MKLGLISDIHCNVRGLQHALDLLHDCDELLCAGDLLYQYRFSAEVLALLQRHRVHAIVGNHDSTILYAPGHPLRSSPSVDPTSLHYLAELPSTLALTLDGASVAMFHGSPWDEPNNIAAYYIYPESRRDIARLATVRADIIVLGHTHQPFFTWIGETLVVNPGSCGESRDPSGLLSCAMLDTDTGHVEFRPFHA